MDVDDFSNFKKKRQRLSIPFQMPNLIGEPQGSWKFENKKFETMTLGSLLVSRVEMRRWFLKIPTKDARKIINCCNVQTNCTELDFRKYNKHSFLYYKKNRTRKIFSYCTYVLYKKGSGFFLVHHCRTLTIFYSCSYIQYLFSTFEFFIVQFQSHYFILSVTFM